MADYREESTVSFSSARELATQAICQAQKKYKRNYDKKVVCRDYRIGDWVLVRFLADETGKMRKLSRPWHGPYRVTGLSEPDVTVVKVYRPQDRPICVHQARVTPCPDAFPAGYFWYGDCRSSPGRPPRWVDRLLQDKNQDGNPSPDSLDVEDQPSVTPEDSPGDTEQSGQEKANATGVDGEPSSDAMIKDDGPVPQCRPGPRQ